MFRCEGLELETTVVEKFQYWRNAVSRCGRHVNFIVLCLPQAFSALGGPLPLVLTTSFA